MRGPQGQHYHGHERLDRSSRETPPTQTRRYADEDDDDDDDSVPVSSAGYGTYSVKTNSGLRWIIICFIVLILVKIVPHTFYEKNIPQYYQVTGVSNGYLHTINVDTGRAASFNDYTLVMRALNGQLKQGDIVQIRPK